MGGEQTKRTLDAHDTVGPETMLTAEEFRAQFTEEMREEIVLGLELLQHHRFFQGKLDGQTPQDSGKTAHDRGSTGRKALQLLHGIAPAPYRW